MKKTLKERGITSLYKKNIAKLYYTNEHTKLRDDLKKHDENLFDGFQPGEKIRIVSDDQER